MKNVLVSPPSFYGVNYEINAWMNSDVSVDSKKANLQWIRMCDRIVRSGAYLSQIKPDPDLPDMVFTANACLVVDKTVVLSNNRHKERQGESALFKRWFLDNGYRVIELPDNIYFEGAGDAIFFENVLFMGYGFRTSIESHKIIAKVFDVDYVSCELVNPHFYHLDTCFFPMKERFMYYRDAFSSKTCDKIMNKVFEKCLFSQTELDILNVDKQYAEQFICNSLEIDDNIITPSADGKDMFGNKHDVHCCDMSEFMKAGGAVRCLTLEL